MQLTDFKALSFDCYGTLIDWEAGLLASLESLRVGVSQGDQNKLTDNDVLETYARWESFQEKCTPTKPYSELMATVYKRMAETWEQTVSWAECLEFGQSLREWPVFPDSAEALAYLKQHYKLVILSNVDNESFAASQAKLGVPFDFVFTAQDIGTYKPSENNFHYMVDALAEQGIARGDILHTAQSLFHDHQPANRCGLKSCWIDRQHAQAGSGATPTLEEMPHCDFQFRNMAELVEAHRAIKR